VHVVVVVQVLLAVGDDLLVVLLEARLKQLHLFGLLLDDLLGHVHFALHDVELFVEHVLLVAHVREAQSHFGLEDAHLLLEVVELGVLGIAVLHLVRQFLDAFIGLPQTVLQLEDGFPVVQLACALGIQHVAHHQTHFGLEFEPVEFGSVFDAHLLAKLSRVHLLHFV